MSLNFLKTASVPTLDRPFGVELWPIFSRAYSSITGYPPTKLQLVPGATPMLTLGDTVITLVTYYLVIFGGREIMKNRKPFKLKTIFIIHNTYLTAISAVLLALFVEQLVPTLWRNGFLFTICKHEGGWTKELATLYYLNYLTKYLELIDTVFLVLKKKPLTFLHTYHHGATALLCYTQLVGSTPVSWVPITLNLGVHVLMYSYYGLAAAGIRVPWKKQITISQIIQFVIDLFVIYFASWTYFTSTYFPWLPNCGVCAGEEFAAIAGCVILSSYLVLFIMFYLATYKTGQRGRLQSGGAKHAVIAMAREQVPNPAATSSLEKVDEIVGSTINHLSSRYHRGDKSVIDRRAF